MTRFLMLVGVAAVAAAMYVAASPASQQSKFATEKQFVALQKKVATLSKNLKAVKSEADAAIGLIGDCFLTINGSSVSWKAMDVSQLGNNTQGYLFGDSGTSAPTTALDIVPSSPQFYLQEVDPTCATLTAARHGAARSGSNLLQRWIKSTR
jgi:hypothetical protein